MDINRAWNMPVGGFIQELKSLKEEVNKINEVSQTHLRLPSVSRKREKSTLLPQFDKLFTFLKFANKQ